MINKVLIVVDMQNDFIDGTLANTAAQKIVKPIADKIESWDGGVIFTLDTHGRNYLETNEGKHLPIEHCIGGTNGWRIHPKLSRASTSLIVNTHDNSRVQACEKRTFGAGAHLAQKIVDMCSGEPEEIILCGTCTDICVITNALYLKQVFPEVKISVEASLCAGLTPELHDCALRVMKSCQIEVIDD